MFGKTEFIQILDNSLKHDKKRMAAREKERSHILIAHVETVDIDIEGTMRAWAKENNVNFAVVDISALTILDVEAIPEILRVPTVFLLKNFGDETHEMLREPFRQLVKDCCYGTSRVFAENFLFAVATTKSNQPISNLGERSCFWFDMND